MKQHTLIAIDLAKNVFQVCLLGPHNTVISNKTLSRSKFSEFMAQQSPTVIAMEACYSSHYWARLFEASGHQVKLLPAQHVKPFVRGNKSDHNDALAIAETVQRPNIRCVPVKSLAQQDIQSLHRLRERIVAQRTGLTNQTRGLLSEYGIVFPHGFKAFRVTLTALLDPVDDRVSALLKQQLQHIYEEFVYLNARLKELNQTLTHIANDHPECRRLLSIPGIGIVNATALYSAMGNGNQFANAREVSVWLGLTPKLRASGDKQHMGGISKRGDRYLRKQLIHGARAFMTRCKRYDDPLSLWVNVLTQRRGPNKACVALASKLARLAWVLLQRSELYRSH